VITGLVSVPPGVALIVGRVGSVGSVGILGSAGMVGIVRACALVVMRAIAKKPSTDFLLIDILSSCLMLTPVKSFPLLLCWEH
jgi:hypothetical protein